MQQVCCHSKPRSQQVSQTSCTLFFLFSYQEPTFTGSNYPVNKIIDAGVLATMQQVCCHSKPQSQQGSQTSCTWMLVLIPTSKSFPQRISLSSRCVNFGCDQLVLFSMGSVNVFQPKYRLGHPEKYLFLLSVNTSLGSKYPNKNQVKYERTFTVWDQLLLLSSGSVVVVQVGPVVVVHLGSVFVQFGIGWCCPVRYQLWMFNWDQLGSVAIVQFGISCCCSVGIGRCCSVCPATAKIISRRSTLTFPLPALLNSLCT